MKEVFIYFIASLSPILCFLFAGLLSYKGYDGWGWFLFAGLVLVPSLEKFFKFDKNKKKKKEVNTKPEIMRDDYFKTQEVK